MNYLIKVILLVGLLVSKQAWSQNVNEALSMVKNTFAVVLDDLKKNNAYYQSNQEALFAMINREMLPVIDEKLMARYVLGNNWKSATEQQKTDFIKAFEKQVFKSYGTSLLDFTDITVKYGQPSPAKKKRTKIKLLIENNDGKNYPVELSLRFKKGRWYIYDASLDGLSIIVSLRSSIGEEVTKKGIQTVINELNQ